MELGSWSGSQQCTGLITASGHGTDDNDDDDDDYDDGLKVVDNNSFLVFRLTYNLEFRMKAVIAHILNPS